MSGERRVPLLTVDPRRWLEAVRSLGESADLDDLGRRRLAVFVDHLAAEIGGDVERAMGAFVAEPRFRGWGGGIDSSGPFDIGRAQIRANYEALLASGFPPIELLIDRLVVDDDAIAIEGDLVTANRREPGRGVISRLLLIVAFDGVAMVGEDQYWTTPYERVEIGEQSL